MSFHFFLARCLGSPMVGRLGAVQDPAAPAPIAEDADLWPRMRAHLADHPDNLALPQAMRGEHDRIDPLLDAVDDALADPD